MRTLHCAGVVVVGLLVVASPASASDLQLVDVPLDQTDPRAAGVEVHSFSDAPADESLTFHATGVVGLVRATVPGLRLTVLEALPAADDAARDRQMAAALAYAGARGGVVNVSMGKPFAHPLSCEAISEHRRALYVVAAGNDGRDLAEPSYTFEPAECGARNQLVIGSASPQSNFGQEVDLLAGDFATSGSAALVSAHAAKLMRKVGVRRSARGMRILRRGLVRSGRGSQFNPRRAGRAVRRQWRRHLRRREGRP